MKRFFTLINVRKEKNMRVNQFKHLGKSVNNHIIVELEGNSLHFYAYDELKVIISRDTMTLHFYNFPQWSATVKKNVCYFLEKEMYIEILPKNLPKYCKMGKIGGYNIKTWEI